MAKKILLVDDSALMRSILGDIINKDSRFHVEDKAKDGSEALELLRTKKYDAMVLDINMPVMNCSYFFILIKYVLRHSCSVFKYTDIS